MFMSTFMFTFDEFKNNHEERNKYITANVKMTM